MTAIRFDAGKNARVAKLDEEWPLDDVIWYLTDGNSNGRWLYVDHPSRDGIPVGIQRVYQKFLSPEAARELAAALLEAADAGDVLRAERVAERDARAALVRECEARGGHEWGPPPMAVTHATGYVQSGGTRTVSGTFKVCRRCDRGEWFVDPISPGRD